LRINTKHEGHLVNNLDTLLTRKKDFAPQQSAAGTLLPSLPRSPPNVKAVIIGCVRSGCRRRGFAPGEPALPGNWLISGLVYDVATGLVEIVVPAAPKTTTTTRDAATSAK
jgi:hypothetical protein